MTMLLDPTAESEPSTRPLAPRLSGLSGVTVALLDISKPRGSLVIDHFESRLRQLGATPIRFVKPTFAKPAPVDLRAEITAQCGAVIEALAD
jgi:hypothetical protein